MAVDDPISAFLHYGYLPRADRSFLDRVLAGMSALDDDAIADDAGWIRAGARALQSCFEGADGGVHVVPLSGGFDSRAILAGLIAAGVRERVVTVTMGTPGTFDFEIAKQVASAANVPHEGIDLRHVRLAKDSLQAAVVSSGGCSWAFDAFFHRLIPARFGPDATYWSGFMGGPVAGGHLPADPPGDWSVAVRHFAAHERFCRRGSLTRPGFAAEDPLPPRPLCDRSLLTYGDQLDFAVRQGAYLRRTVVVQGYDYRTPFMTPAWLRFMLRVPPRLRHGEELFKRILLATFPDLFSLPSKNTAGLPVGTTASRVRAKVRLMKVGASIRSGSIVRDLRRRRMPVPFQLINYLDFADALRSKPDAREVVFDLVRALDDRGVVGWISGTEIWAENERAGGDTDLGCALTLLASLEVNLRADASRARPRFAQER